jgi:4-amino-4-deoxy-L-arabinose transferase-like glycosyltransferase
MLGRIAFILIFIVAFFIRVNQLGTIPPGMTDDEIRLVYSAYSLWHTGRDVTGHTFLPFSFVLNNFSFNPVAVYAAAPFVGLLGLSPLTARLPFALAGLGVVFLTYLLTKRITENRMIALLSAVFLAFNVWAIQLSRMAYEAVFAQVFYLWGTYVFMCDWKKHPSRTVLFSMVLFFLAFNSYNATKILLIPVVLILCWVRRKGLFKSKKLAGIVVTGVLISLAVFIYFSVTQGAGIHGGDITIFQNSSAASTDVNNVRRVSSAPVLLSYIFHNKPAYFARVFFVHYLNAFSPDFLFLHQEASGIFSLWSRGNLYLIELPFLLFGLFFVWKNHRKYVWFVIAMLAVAPLPAAVGPEPFTYATRAAFMLPWLAVLTGAGVWYGLSGIPQILLRRAAISVVVMLYVYAVAGYFVQYYFEWPRAGAKYFSKDIKDIVQYILNAHGNRKFFVSNVNDTLLLQYAFYANVDPRLVQRSFGSPHPSLTVRPVTVLPECLHTGGYDPRSYLDADTVYFTNPICHTQKPDDSIFLPDGTRAWNIYKRQN